ncbi:hypothetical protein VAE151_560786 [Vibrio aestuarianus]|nr:hypothetical protein VIBAE_A32023 [Vibrio aestuarianus subsp. francensis]CAH8210425.1 hypothetical protein VAE055_380779 [Vibrio aestuarianus]CAH8210431.1 hypothetical protein VAE032_271426 [Vibrio aestuarianus]CAH8210578.1 hypothetical protein VAE128_461431 [Vibrio aestuarianus]CAH8210774.1 hypothetical protein VAE130_571426 [Vibrio aestuarianus]
MQLFLTKNKHDNNVAQVIFNSKTIDIFIINTYIDIFSGKKSQFKTLPNSSPLK